MQGSTKPPKSLITMIASDEPTHAFEAIKSQASCDNIEVRIRSHKPSSTADESQWDVSHTQMLSDYLLSDAIIFDGCDEHRTVTAYLAAASMFAVKPAVDHYKPTAFVCLPRRRTARTRNDFVLACLMNNSCEWQCASEILYGAFAEVYLVEARSSVGAGVVKSAADLGRRQRAQQGRLWTASTYTAIERAFRHHRKRSRTAASQREFEICAAVTLAHQALTLSDDFAALLVQGLTLQQIVTHSVPIAAAFLLRHARLSKHWAQWPSRCSRELDQQQHFAYHHFQTRYKAPLLRTLRAQLSSEDAEGVVKMIYDVWVDYLRGDRQRRSAATSLERHFARLAPHSAFLASRDFAYSCCGCLTCAWTTVLPCRDHGLCKNCATAFVATTLSQTNSRPPETRCPICQKSDLNWKLCPRQACEGGVVLSLDGGGVRGFVQLEVLRLLENAIGLGRPIQTYFDLIVGSSVGGIAALGLGVQKWSVEQCQAKLLDLSEQVFAQPSFLSRAMSTMTNGMSQKIWHTYRLLTNGSIHDARVLEGILQASFGLDSRLLGAHGEGPNVAVTATSTTAPFCELLTTYSKSGHKSCHSLYRWFGGVSQGQPKPADWRRRRATSVWEAARCTSAAPVYFNPFTVAGTTLHDGAMVFNNPAAVARTEGSELFDCDPENIFCLSVGNGQNQLSSYTDGLVSRVYNGISYKTSPAYEEQLRLLWGSPAGSYIRLDPLLEMEQIGLDDISSLLRLRERLCEQLRANSKLSVSIDYCAWQLVARCFSCVPAEDRSGLFIIRCRPNHDPLQMLQKWPSLRLVLTDGTALVPHELALTVDLPADETGIVVIELVAGKRRAPISGFPTMMQKLSKRAWANSVPHVLEKRKRCD